jgi:hypothetical protein
VREIVACYVDAVNRLGEVIGVGQAGEDNGEDRGPGSSVPDGYGNGKEEKLHFYVAKTVVLHQQRQGQGNREGSDRKTVA